MEPSFKDDTLLARWLSGELSQAEERELRQRPDFADYERIADSASRLQPPAYDARAELARLKARRATAHKGKTLHPPRNAAGLTRPRRTTYRVWYAAAASVALLLAAWFLLPDGMDRYEQVGRHALADGSVAQLNAASELSFRNGETREAGLRGEAFFEVEKSDRPFTVATELGTVRVLGTQFNVYQRDGEMRVSCTEGKVGVNFSGKPKAYVLTAGMSVSLLPNGDVSEAPIPAEEVADWLKGRSYFSNRPLREIIRELERQYALSIKLPPGMDIESLITIKFPNNDRRQALDNVFSTLPGLSYRQEGQTVIVQKE